MKFSFFNDVLVIYLDMVSFLFFAVIMLLIGYLLKRKILLFNRFCIPAPVIGGFIFALIALLLKSSNLILFEMDNSLQKPLMLVFFTTIGLGASFGLVKRGGKALIIYWFFCALLSIFQNAIGVTIAQIMNINPLIGVLTGSVSMEGGHGAAAAFGPTIENLGVSGAATIALASATFGLVMGGLIGGPMAGYLINKHKLASGENTHEFSFHNKEEITGSRIGVKTLFMHIAIRDILKSCV